MDVGTWCLTSCISVGATFATSSWSPLGPVMYYNNSLGLWCIFILLYTYTHKLYVKNQLGFKTTQISSSTKSILPNEAFYIIHVSGNTLIFSSSFIFMPFVGMLQLILTSQFFIDRLKSDKYQIGFQDRKPPVMLQHFKKTLLACSWLWMPENCIRLQCRQSSDKPLHPEHHCYSIWPRTGNIIRAHREPAKILLNSQEGYTFYSPSNPPPQPTEHRLYTTRRSNRRGVTEATSAGDSLWGLSALCELKLCTDGATAALQIIIHFPRISIGLCAPIVWDSWSTNIVYINVRGCTYLSVEEAVKDCNHKALQGQKTRGKSGISLY